VVDFLVITYEISNSILQAHKVASGDLVVDGGDPNAAEIAEIHPSVQGDVLIHIPTGTDPEKTHQNQV